MTAFLFYREYMYIRKENIIMDENKNIAKTYDPKEFEDRLYAWWEEKGFFTPEIDKNKKPYSIIMPPPNITGQLHLGHAIDDTLQDILIRTDRKSTRLNSSHANISYAVFCLKKKKS